jgi:hypothetical protein
MPCPSILCDLITRTIFGEECKSWSCSLCYFLHSPVISSLLGPNSFLITIFSNTLSVRFSISMRDQVRLTTYLHLVPRWRMSGAISPLNMPLLCVCKNKCISFYWLYVGIRYACPLQRRNIRYCWLTIFHCFVGEIMFVGFVTNASCLAPLGL